MKSLQSIFVLVDKYLFNNKRNTIIHVPIRIQYKMVMRMDNI